MQEKLRIQWIIHYYWVQPSHLYVQLIDFHAELDVVDKEASIVVVDLEENWAMEAVAQVLVELEELVVAENQ